VADNANVNIKVTATTGDANASIQVLTQTVQQLASNMQTAFISASAATAQLADHIQGLGQKHEEAGHKTEAHSVALGMLIAEGVEKCIEKGRELIETLREWSHEAAVNEQANILLDNALRAQGSFTPELSAHYKELADHLSNVAGVADNQVVTALTGLITIGNVSAVNMDRVTKAAMNFGDQMGYSLPQAMSMVERAAAGHTTMLHRMGLNFVETGDKVKDFNHVLEAMEQMSRGATDSMQTSVIRMEAQMNISLGKMEETIGSVVNDGIKPFIIVIRDAAQEVQRFVEEHRTEILNDFKTALELLVPILTVLAKQVVVVGLEIAELADTIHRFGGPIKESVESFNSWGNASHSLIMALTPLAVPLQVLNFAIDKISSGLQILLQGFADLTSGLAENPMFTGAIAAKLGITKDGLENLSGGFQDLADRVKNSSAKHEDFKKKLEEIGTTINGNIDETMTKLQKLLADVGKEGMNAGKGVKDGADLMGPSLSSVPPIIQQIGDHVFIVGKQFDDTFTRIKNLTRDETQLLGSLRDALPDVLAEKVDTLEQRFALLTKTLGDSTKASILLKSEAKGIADKYKEMGEIVPYSVQKIIDYSGAAEKAAKMHAAAVKQVTDNLKEQAKVAEEAAKSAGKGYDMTSPAGLEATKKAADAAAAAYANVAQSSKNMGKEATEAAKSAAQQMVQLVMGTAKFANELERIKAVTASITITSDEKVDIDPKSGPIKNILDDINTMVKNNAPGAQWLKTFAENLKSGDLGAMKKEVDMLNQQLQTWVGAGYDHISGDLKNLVFSLQNKLNEAQIAIGNQQKDVIQSSADVQDAGVDAYHQIGDAATYAARAINGVAQANRSVIGEPTTANKVRGGGGLRDVGPADTQGGLINATVDNTKELGGLRNDTRSSADKIVKSLGEKNDTMIKLLRGLVDKPAIDAGTLTTVLAKAQRQGLAKPGNP